MSKRAEEKLRKPVKAKYAHVRGRMEEKGYAQTKYRQTEKKSVKKRQLNTYYTIF